MFAFPVNLLQRKIMFKPNPVEFELPYDQGLLLQLRGEWIAEQKMVGVRAVLEFGTLKTPHTDLRLPGPLPVDWKSHVFDGILVDNVYYLFDLMVLDGEDTQGRPLYERRTLLRSLKLPLWCTLVPSGKNIGEFLEAVVHNGGRGIVLKNLLERYGQAQWMKVERSEVKEVVISAIDEATRSVEVKQFHQDMLVGRGTVFLGSLLEQASVGQVLDVDMRGCTPRSCCIGQPRFVRFRADNIQVPTSGSTSESPADPSRFMRLGPQ